MTLEQNRQPEYSSATHYPATHKLYQSMLLESRRSTTERGQSANQRRWSTTERRWSITVSPNVGKVLVHRQNRRTTERNWQTPWRSLNQIRIWTSIPRDAVKPRPHEDFFLEKSDWQLSKGARQSKKLVNSLCVDMLVLGFSTVYTPTALSETVSQSLYSKGN